MWQTFCQYNRVCNYKKETSVCKCNCLEVLLYDILCMKSVYSIMVCIYLSAIFSSIFHSSEFIIIELNLMNYYYCGWYVCVVIIMVHCIAESTAGTIRPHHVNPHPYCLVIIPNETRRSCSGKNDLLYSQFQFQFQFLYFRQSTFWFLHLVVSVWVDFCKWRTKPKERMLISILEKIISHFMSHSIIFFGVKLCSNQLCEEFLPLSRKVSLCGSDDSDSADNWESISKLKST